MHLQTQPAVERRMRYDDSGSNSSHTQHRTHVTITLTTSTTHTITACTGRETALLTVTIRVAAHCLIKELKMAKFFKTPFALEGDRALVTN